MLNGRGAAALAQEALHAIDTQWAELKAEANQVRESLRSMDGERRDVMDRLTAAPLAAALRAIDKKRLYLNDLVASLNGEMRQRTRRVAELRDLVAQATADPDQAIGPEREKRLRSMADGCADLKDRMLLFSRALHHGIFAFSDYAAVAIRLESEPNALVYDIMCESIEEPMPPGDFVRAVIPEVDQHRRRGEARS